MMINKKLLQVISALMILIFHVWMPMNSSTASQLILKTGYIGVDIFFFLAAYSLADRQIEYKAFLADRLRKIYIKFLLFSIAAALYKGWSISRLLKVITGVEFLQRGGGSFLWFIPAIMIFYLLYPLYLKLNEKTRVYYALAAWAAFSLTAQYGFGSTAVFIFTNRIPVILAGSVFKKYKLPNGVYPVLIPIGTLLVGLFGFNSKLNYPIKDLYFAAAVPLVVGLAWLSGFVHTGKIINLLGSCTLELYALQVIFGPAAVRLLHGLTGSVPATNLLSVTSLWLSAILISKGGLLIYDKRKRINTA